MEDEVLDPIKEHDVLSSIKEHGFYTKKFKLSLSYKTYSINIDQLEEISKKNDLIFGQYNNNYVCLPYDYLINDLMIFIKNIFLYHENILLNNNKKKFNNIFKLIKKKSNKNKKSVLSKYIHDLKIRKMIESVIENGYYSKSKLQRSISFSLFFEILKKNEKYYLKFTLRVCFDNKTDYYYFTSLQ